MTGCDRMWQDVTGFVHCASWFVFVFGNFLSFISISQVLLQIHVWIFSISTLEYVSGFLTGFLSGFLLYFFPIFKIHHLFHSFICHLFHLFLYTIYWKVYATVEFWGSTVFQKIFSSAVAAQKIFINRLIFRIKWTSFWVSEI